MVDASGISVEPGNCSDEDNHKVDAGGIGVVHDDYNSDEVSPLSLRLSRRTVRGA